MSNNLKRLYEHFPLWDGSEPLKAGILCCGADGKCPQTFMCWRLGTQCSKVRGGAFLRWLGLQDPDLMNRLVHLLIQSIRGLREGNCCKTSFLFASWKQGYTWEIYCMLWSLSNILPWWERLACSTGGCICCNDSRTSVMIPGVWPSDPRHLAHSLASLRVLYWLWKGDMSPCKKQTPCIMQ
jgi:hypothetical protein